MRLAGGDATRERMYYPLASQYHTSLTGFTP
jgi:hypothetical protein